jgi:hypothetical protein
METSMKATTSANGPYFGEFIDPFSLPARYPNNEAFMGIFGADIDKVRALLPSEDLHPVRLTAGRAAIAVSAMYFPLDIIRGSDGKAATGPAYGEMSIAALCTFRSEAPPFLPLAGLPLRDEWQLGVFFLHLPVTSIEAWEAGRIVWNAPKFVADMDFELGPDALAATLEENGQRILRLVTRRGGITRRDNNPLIWFAPKDGKLLRSRCEVDGVQQLRIGKGAGRLELGDHPIADELRWMGIDTKPMAVQTYLRHSLVLPAPEIVGAAETHDGLLRDEEPRRGRLVLHYPNVAPIDVYALAADQTTKIEPAEVDAPASGASRRQEADVAV